MTNEELDKFERVPDDSPDRCHAVAGAEQCHLRKQPGSDFCICHGGNRAGEEAKRRGLKNLRLSQWMARLVEGQVKSPEIMSLRDEIGILRILLEEKLSACHNTFDLITSTSGILDLVGKIRDLLTSCHKLEEAMGKHLDEAALMRFTEDVITIITEEVENPELIGRISKRLIAAHQRATGDKNEEDIDD